MKTVRNRKEPNTMEQLIKITPNPTIANSLTITPFSAKKDKNN
jgi:hypothetical protein